MPARAFGLGQSIIRVLGLRDSILPQVLLDEIARGWDLEYQITVGADSAQVPCGSHGTHVESPGGARGDVPKEKGGDSDPGRAPSPGEVKLDRVAAHTCCDLGTATVLPPERTNSISITVSVENVCEVTISMRLTVKAQIVTVDRRGNCPELCTSEALGMAVMVSYEMEFGLSGSLTAVRDTNSADRTSLVPVPDKVNFGPTLGEQDVWDWWGWNAEVGISISKTLNLTDTLQFTVTCNDVVPGTVSGILPIVPAPGAGTTTPRPPATPPVAPVPSSVPDHSASAPGSNLPRDCTGLSGPPAWQRQQWLGSTTRRRNNCYNYACNIANDTYAQPGFGSPNDNDQYDPGDSPSCEDWHLALVADGLREASTDIGDQTACGSECHKVAFFLAVHNGRLDDFHLVRQDADGMWSHKRGRTDPSRVTNSRGQPVRQLADANMEPYNRFCGYFCVCKCQVTINS